MDAVLYCVYRLNVNAIDLSSALCMPNSMTSCFCVCGAALVRGIKAILALVTGVRFLIHTTELQECLLCAAESGM